MDERLRHLKGSMKQSVFQNLKFTDKHKQAIKRQIKQENILLPALQLLSVEKNGIELVQKLRSRGIQEFDEQEGFVYILLHQLEQKSYVTSRWKEDQKKYYQLNSKGKKVMKSLENGSQRSAFVLQGLLGGGQ